MKKTLVLAVLVAVALAPSFGYAAEEKNEDAAVAPIKLDTKAQKVSYIIGTQIGTSMKGDDLDIDMKSFIRGIEDARAGREPALSKEEMQEVMAAFQQEMMQKAQAARAAAGEKAAAEGEKFLADNAKKPGVKTTPSGLQYMVEKSGDGAMPKETDVVRTHYRGTLVDGTVFDSSYDRGEPVEFPVNGVIPGWTEALQMMHVGDKWKLFIPAKLAYGERGAGNGQIPPNATLIFDIELLNIVKDNSIAIPKNK